MTNSFFINMIRNLRQQEEILLYGNLLHIEQLETIELVEFLRYEYEQEALDYPYTAPAFDEEAALWAATTVYLSAQLILYRKSKEVEVSALLPAFAGELTPSTILSADLCLRFLPNMLIQLKMIDTQDQLIEVLENLLQHWHYSGINYSLETEKLNFEHFTADRCLQQLYVNRVIAYKKLPLAKHPACRHLITANMGMFGDEFWKDFKLETTIE